MNNNRVVHVPNAGQTAKSISGGRPFRNACFFGLKIYSTDHEGTAMGIPSDDSNIGCVLLLRSEFNHVDGEKRFGF